MTTATPQCPTDATKATITRERQYPSHGSSNYRYAWKWLYSVQLDASPPIAIGTSLAEARGWAKRRAVTVVETLRAAGVEEA